MPLSVMALSGGQAQPDWEALSIDDCMDFGRETAARSTDTTMCPPFLPSQLAGALGWKFCLSLGFLHRRSR